MAKREKRKLTELLNSDIPDLDKVENVVEQIHKERPQPPVKKEKTVRVTVDTPASMHKSLKKIIVDEGVDLRTFYLQAVKEKCERLGYDI